MNETQVAAHPYTGAVAGLLSFAEPHGPARAHQWPDYAMLGLGRADVPALIRMVGDQSLNCAKTDSLEIWAPVHAWRALAQMGASEAAGPLMRMAVALPDDDWVLSELPYVFAELGPETLPVLDAYLADDTLGDAPRQMAASAIESIGVKHPDAGESCKTMLRERLMRHCRQPAMLNAFLVLGLVDLTASEDIELIREAFGAGNVDPVLMGDLEDVEIELGLRSERSTRRQPNWLMDALMKTPKAPAQTRRQRKVGRNEPCPCGSGTKYKRCCGRT